MTAKHTPGPWELIPTKLAGITDLRAQGRHLLRISDSRVGHIDANARLIASAPDLLEALKALLNRVDPANKEREITPKSLLQKMDQARAAIAKAEGT